MKATWISDLSNFLIKLYLICTKNYSRVQLHFFLVQNKFPYLQTVLKVVNTFTYVIKFAYNFCCMPYIILNDDRMILFDILLILTY